MSAVMGTPSMAKKEKELIIVGCGEEMRLIAILRFLAGESHL